MTTLIKFRVVGRGEFPFDMLRLDECWPATAADADQLSGEQNRHYRVVALVSAKRPTPKLWSSWGWLLEECRG